MVLAEESDSYRSKNNMEVKNQVVTLIDRDPNPEARLKTPVDYNLSDEEKVLYAGKLTDKVIEFAMRDISVFGSRIRVRGKILSVPGIAAEAPKK